MTDERCAACGKAFSPRAKPVWAVTREGRPAGRVHTAPCVHGRDRTLVTFRAATPERAQFDFWLIYVTPRQDTRSDRWYAELLTDGGPHADLTEEQERRLRWWVTRDNGPLPEERIAAIRAAYLGVLADFEAWRSELDATTYRGGCS